jgi:hypothetical protein
MALDIHYIATAHSGIVTAGLDAYRAERAKVPVYLVETQVRGAAGCCLQLTDGRSHFSEQT